MALHLASLVAGTEFAEVLQLHIEYDPQPPFDAGSVDKASPQVLAHAMARIAGASSNPDDASAPADS